MFFMCESSESFEAFKHFSETGRLKSILEQMFHCLLGLSDKETRLIKSVSIVEQYTREQEVISLDEQINNGISSLLETEGSQMNCYIEVS